MKRKSQAGFGLLITLLIIAVVAAVGGFAVYSMRKSNNAAMLQTPTSMESPTPMTAQGVASGQAQVPTQGSTNVTTSAGASDANLTSDSTDVSTKLNALNQDSSSIDTSLNDQQGNLSEN